MARNGSGVFAVPHAVLVGTLRSSADANENFEDIGDEITNSLPIDGQAAMSGQLKVSNGSVTQPGLSFGSDTNVGLRRRGNDAMAWVVGAQDRLYIDEDGNGWITFKADAAGDVTATGGLGECDLAAIEALDGTGVARRTGDKQWELDEGVFNIPFVLNRDGTEIQAGSIFDVMIPFACTLTGITMVGDQEGSCVLDIWKDSLANYPPTDADSICGSNKPTISAGTSYEDDELTGWTTAVSAGDCLRFNLDSVEDFTALEIFLQAKRWA